MIFGNKNIRLRPREIYYSVKVLQKYGLSRIIKQTVKKIIVVIL